MKIKRYVAPDIRQAIRMVREEQGPDAVILSNKRVEEGVEIIAAVDYDEGVIAKTADVETADAAPHAKLNTTANDPDKESTKDKDPSGMHFYQALTQQLKQEQAAKEKVPENTQSLALVQNEIKTLRNLLENQLSGLAWADMQLRKPVRAKLLRRLMGLGLTAELCKRIAQEVDMNLSEDDAWRSALELLTKKIPTTTDQHFSSGSIISLLGATGVGKTTTIAKIAARYAMTHDPRHILLVSTDNYRIGGQEQLRVYSRILGIGLQILSSPSELEDLVKNASQDQLILIDTSGAQVRTQPPKQQFEFLAKVSMRVKNYLLLPATAQRTDLEDIVKAFGDMHIQGCIVTKMDECSNLGGVLSVVAKNRLPIAYISEGQRVPEDLQVPKAGYLVSKCVTLSRYNKTPIEEDELALEFGETTDHASIQ